MLKSIDRFINLYNILGIKFVILKEHIWREYQKMVIPVGPASLDYSITEEEAKYLLSQFQNALLVRWTDGFNQVSDSKWYAVVLDKFHDLEDLASTNRSEVKRGLKNCVAERVGASFLAANGYDVFISAFMRYKNVPVPKISKEDYRMRMLKLNNFDDIVHFWGVFYKNHLIAYSENYIYDDIEVSYSTIKFNPDYLRLYPSYALFYTMNRYYLKEQKVEYVNDGFRNILHKTNIQEYLLKKFYFKKRYTNLYVFYKPVLSTYLKITFPLRNYLKKIHPKLEALYIMEEIKKSRLIAQVSG